MVPSLAGFSWCPSGVLRVSPQVFASGFPGVCCGLPAFPAWSLGFPSVSRWFFLFSQRVLWFSQCLRRFSSLVFPVFALFFPFGFPSFCVVLPVFSTRSAAGEAEDAQGLLQRLSAERLKAARLARELGPALLRAKELELRLRDEQARRLVWLVV